MAFRSVKGIVEFDMFIEREGFLGCFISSAIPNMASNYKTGHFLTPSASILFLPTCCGDNNHLDLLPGMRISFPLVTEFMHAHTHHPDNS